MAGSIGEASVDPPLDPISDPSSDPPSALLWIPEETPKLKTILDN